MKINIKHSRLFVLVCLSFVIHIVQARELIIYVSSSLPPFVMEGSRHGIASEIIERALATQGHSAKIMLSNNRRMEVDVRSGLADAGFAGIGPGSTDIFFSDAVVEFDNVAISLANRQLQINKLSDLSTLRVIAFPNALRVLGVEFADAVGHSPFYYEVGAQRSQLPMLNLDRGDVVVLERRAFLYFAHKSGTPTSNLARYTMHPIFKKIPRSLGFRRASDRDSFNAGLQAIRKSGEYEAIVRSYINE
ncbi:hypothetical protein BH11PSE12_BH11PSE12_16060 [soil metagenome]